MPIRRAFAIAVTALLVLATAACGGSGSASPTPAPSLSSPSSTGRELAAQFMTRLQSRDAAGLDSFLAPAFQIQRADGSGAAKSEYLANLPTIKSFTLGPDLEAVLDGDLLTVRWQLETDEVVNGQTLGQGEAPRLSTFVWRDGRWQMLSHANFNLPAK